MALCPSFPVCSNLPGEYLEYKNNFWKSEIVSWVELVVGESDSESVLTEPDRPALPGQCRHESSQ